MKRALVSQDAPSPIGPYSQGIETAQMVFLSGQIAIDPTTGALETQDIEKETHRVMKNIEALLKEAGLTMADVVKCSIFLKDLGNFDRVNVVYGEYFSMPYPARECVEVARLPKDVNVEISVIACR